MELSFNWDSKIDLKEEIEIRTCVKKKNKRDNNVYETVSAEGIEWKGLSGRDWSRRDWNGRDWNVWDWCDRI